MSIFAFQGTALVLSSAGCCQGMQEIHPACADDIPAQGSARCWVSQGGCSPGVTLDALDVQPLVRVPHKDALYEVPALRADAGVLGDPEVHAHDAVKDLLEAVLVLLVLGALKGVLAEDHDIQHDPAGPDVRLGAVVVRLC